MACCDDKPDLMHASNSTSPFSTMERVRCYKEHFANLMRCQSCGQLWVVDEWDKYANLAAFKVATVHDDVEIAGLLSRTHERLVILDAGGFSNDDCMWTGCRRKALNGMKVCSQHSS